MKLINRKKGLKKGVAILAMCMALGMTTPGNMNVVQATETTTEDNQSIDPNGTLGRNSDIGLKVDKSVIAAAGEPVSLEFTVSSANAKKIKIKDIFPVVDDTFPFETSNDAYKVVSTGNDTEKQQKLSVKYDFVAQSDVKTGYHSVRYIVEYLKDNGSGEEEFYVVKTIKVYFDGVDGDNTNAGGDDTGDTTTPSGDIPAPDDGGSGGDGGSGNVATPKLIITGYETTPKKVMAGDEFTITIHVQNTSKTTAVKNAKFLIGNEAGSILPTSGSSSIYVEKIGAGETGDLTIGMKTASDLPQKSYVIAVKGDFDDSNNTNFTYSENLYLPIYQEIKLGITDVSMTPESIGVGEEGSLMFTINNQGKAGVYNASVKVDSDAVSAEESYVGNIAASSSAYASLALTGVQENPDTGTVTVVISYEDADGTTYEMEQEIDCSVSEYSSSSDTGDEDMMVTDEPTSGLSVLKVIGIIFGILVIIGVIVTVIIIRKKKKAKLEEQELEDEVDVEDEDI